MPCGSRSAMADAPVPGAGLGSTGGLFSGPLASSLAVRSVRHPPRRSCSETEILPSITLATHIDGGSGPERCLPPGHERPEADGAGVVGGVQGPAGDRAAVRAVEDRV